MGGYSSSKNDDEDDEVRHEISPNAFLLTSIGDAGRTGPMSSWGGGLPSVPLLLSRWGILLEHFLKAPLCCNRVELTAMFSYWSNVA